MTWRRASKYHITRKADRARVCKAYGPAPGGGWAWLYRASRGHEWVGPWRASAREAMADCD